MSQYAGYMNHGEGNAIDPPYEPTAAERLQQAEQDAKFATMESLLLDFWQERRRDACPSCGIFVDRYDVCPKCGEEVVP